MKTKILFILGLLVFSNALHGQFQVLEDSLIKDSYYDEYSGDTIISYLDFTGSLHDLPSPRDKHGNKPEVAGYIFNSYENLMQLVDDTFSEEEIMDLINSKCIIRFIALSSGEIVSVSFYFRCKEPEICLDKFVGLSRVIKEEFTHETEFYNSIVTEGYVGSSINLASELRRRELNPQNNNE
jgi:hypothetical protein